MTLMPVRRRNTNNSTVLRPNRAAEDHNGEESDKSILTKPAATANAGSQTEGDATANPPNAQEETANVKANKGQKNLAENKQENQQNPTTTTTGAVIPRIVEVAAEDILAKFSPSKSSQRSKESQPTAASSN